MLERSKYLRDRSRVTVDPFSDLLEVTQARAVVSGAFTAQSPWAVRWPAFDKLKFVATVKGRCWLRVDGDAQPVQIETGDVFLLSGSRGFVVASDLAAKPIEATKLLKTRR